MEKAIKILVSYFGAYDASVCDQGRGTRLTFLEFLNEKESSTHFVQATSQDEKFDMRTHTSGSTGTEKVSLETK